jgi:peptide deformylase
MALLRVLQYPDPRLHKVAAKVERVDDQVRSLVADMAETMYAAPGIGLAATQVDIHRRIIVIDISDTRDQLRTFINPEILEANGEAELEEVVRAQWVRVRALNAEAQSYTLEAEGLLAVCIQHEMDHLEGKVFVERLSRLKQQRILSKLKKQIRQAM